MHLWPEGSSDYIGYVHPFIPAMKVTWLEATIAAPVFSGLVTYYVEGGPSQRRNLMDARLGGAERAWKVRGNLFSFRLPWEHVIRQLRDKCEGGDLSEWPWSPEAMCQAVRVKFTHGSETLSDKFRDLYVRSNVVKVVAGIYVDRHVDDLQDRKGVLEIHAQEKCSTIAASLKAHVEKRVNELYPEKQFGTEEGALLPGVKAAAEALQQEQRTAQREESGFDMKQSTMHDEARSVEDTFKHLRPSIVVDEAESAGAFAPEVVNAQAVQSIVDVEVPISNVLEEQFVGQYMSKIFPYTLNHACGGADWPELFGDWDALSEGDAAVREGLLKPRFRRSAEDAVLPPGAYAEMMATRSEVQVAGDWMVVPSAVQLDWRYKVLRSSFMTCRQRLASGESLNQNLIELIDATEKIWKRLQKNTVTVKSADGESVKMPINGDVRKLFSAVDITAAEKTILRSYLNTTSNIAGCQAIRRQIGHCCFGFRVVHGEVIFVTVSPNRRHSSMILKLSRARRNDTSFDAADSVAGCRIVRWINQCVKPECPENM